MQVGMMKQVRAPSMEHGEKADLSTEVFRISSDGTQGLRCGPEQNAIEFSFILIGNVAIWSGTVNTTWKYSVSKSSA